MTLTNEQIALALDPERRQPRWWAKRIPYTCPHCKRPLHGTFVTPPAEDLEGGYRCLSCLVMHTSEYSCYAPDFLHDDTTAFIHLRPVALALGCSIKIYTDHTCVEYLATGSAWSAPIFCESLCLALSYFMQHDPDALARAVKEVRG